MWTQEWRHRIWSGLNRSWDIVIIGGGITGAGILREAARAGLHVLLLEKGDFASGTSGHSSKLVHGGLRYLRNGQLKTTVASVHEREKLLREGRGLVTPLGFLFVNFEGDRTPTWAVGLGLAFYDLLGLKWGHKHYDPAGLRKLAPHITTDGLLGGYRYFDAQTDDARLVLRVIQEGVRDGGVALNYARVEKLLTGSDGRVCGVAFSDQAPECDGQQAEIQAQVVINASGTSADIFRGQVGAAPRLRYLRGSHLIFGSDRFPVSRAVSFSHPVDLRPVYALPWEGVTIFGTTDVDHQDGPEVEPSISPAEVDYLMVAISYAFPSLQLAHQDIQATMSGIRSVIGTGKADPSDESREHVLWNEKGLLTVAGGKLTTFRVMALEALRSIRRQLPNRPRFRSQRVLDKPGQIDQEVPLDPLTCSRLVGRYGVDTSRLLAAARSGELEAIGGANRGGSLWAEVRWAARAEGVVHLEDLLLRRVRLGLILPEGGLPWIDRIRAIVQEECSWDDERWEREMLDYCRVLREYYSLPADF